MYQPKTGAKCSCKRGVERDNCPTCEGTGWVIDFHLILARRAKPVTDVCLAGEPAINGKCGNPWCVCA